MDSTCMTCATDEADILGLGLEHIAEAFLDLIHYCKKGWVHVACKHIRCMRLRTGTTKSRYSLAHIGTPFGIAAASCEFMTCMYDMPVWNIALLQRVR